MRVGRYSRSWSKGCFICHYKNTHAPFLEKCALRNQKMTSVCRDSAVGTPLRCGLHGPGFETSQDQEIFLFFKTSRPALWPTQPPVQWPRGFIPVIKWASDKLTTHIQPVPRLRMSGATPPVLFNDDYEKHRRQWTLLNKAKEMKQLFELA